MGHRSFRKVLKSHKDQSGSQILEFALVLPLLVVFVVAIFDFGAAFNFKQKLNNAARDAARIAAAQTFDDLPGSGGSPPTSIRSLADGVIQYMAKAALTGCNFRTATYSRSGFVYTFTAAAATNCPGGATLVINRAEAGPNVNGHTTVLTRVSINYPYRWAFGRIISLVGGANRGDSVRISSNAAMQNQV